MGSGGAEHVARMAGTRNTSRLFVEKTWKKKESMWSTDRRIWVEMLKQGIKTNLKIFGWEEFECTHLSQGKDQLGALVSTVETLRGSYYMGNIYGCLGGKYKYRNSSYSPRCSSFKFLVVLHAWTNLNCIEAGSASLIGQKSVVTHTIRQTEIPVLLHSRATNTACVKILYPQNSFLITLSY